MFFILYAFFLRVAPRYFAIFVANEDEKETKLILLDKIEKNKQTPKREDESNQEQEWWRVEKIVTGSKWLRIWKSELNFLTHKYWIAISKVNFMRSVSNFTTMVNTRF